MTIREFQYITYLPSLLFIWYKRLLTQRHVLQPSKVTSPAASESRECVALRFLGVSLCTRDLKMKETSRIVGINKKTSTKNIQIERKDTRKKLYNYRHISLEKCWFHSSLFLTNENDGKKRQKIIISVLLRKTRVKSKQFNTNSRRKKFTSEKHLTEKIFTSPLNYSFIPSPWAPRWLVTGGWAGARYNGRLMIIAHVYCAELTATGEVCGEAGRKENAAWSARQWFRTMES